MNRLKTCPHGQPLEECCECLAANPSQLTDSEGRRLRREWAKKEDVSTCDECGGPMLQSYASPFGSQGDGQHYCAKCAGVEPPNTKLSRGGTMRNRKEKR